MNNVLEKNREIKIKTEMKNITTHYYNGESS